jgi:uncharacterized protein
MCVRWTSLPGAYRSGDPVKNNLSYLPESIFPPVQETVGENSSLLWQISGNGLEEPSYLFGTLHLICPERFSFPVEWMFYFYNTSQLVLELDLSDPGLAQEFQEGMFMTDGNSIEGLLDTPDLQILADFLADSVDLDITHTRRIMPMLLSAFLYPHMLRCQPESYDYYLTEIALQNDLRSEPGNGF